MMKNVYLWHWYNFNKEYGRMPVDLDDFLDGLTAMIARDKIRGILMEKD